MKITTMEYNPRIILGSRLSVDLKWKKKIEVINAIYDIMCYEKKKDKQVYEVFIHEFRFYAIYVASKTNKLL